MGHPQQGMEQDTDQGLDEKNPSGDGAGAAAEAEPAGDDAGEGEADADAGAADDGGEADEASDGADAGDGGEAEGDAEEGAEEGEQGYKPSLKFKVYDKEHDFDPVFKDLVQSEEQEKKLRELHEKAFGLDIVKPKFLEMRKQHQALSEEHDGLLGGLQDLKEMVQRRDFDGFFQRLKIPQEMLLQWMVEKVQYEKLPPEQRQVIDARKQAEREALEARKTLNAREQQYFQQASQAKGRLLDMALERAEISAFAAAYDAKEGRPGAFRDAVCDYGEAVYFARKEDLSPEQAIQEVMQHYGKFISPASPAAMPAAPANQGVSGQKAPAARKEPPVIPNVAGRQSSPAKSTSVKSIDDLRKIRQKMLEG